MKRLFRKLHLWLSVPLGLVVALVCFSGAMLVFEEEVTEALYPERYFVDSIGAKPLPVGELAARVARTLLDSVAVTGVTAASDPSRTWQVGLSAPRRAAVFVDPYAGTVAGRAERPAFFMTMFRLHRWLLDSPKAGGGASVGKLVVGISTLLFVAALLTGVVVWWPRTRRALAAALTVPLRRGSFAFWRGLHVAGGMYALVFLLLMALTGLTWSFAWYRSAFYGLFGVEAKAPEGRGAAAPETPGRHGRGAAARLSHADGDFRAGRNDRPEGRSERPARRSEWPAREHDLPAGRDASATAAFDRWQDVLDELAARHPGWEKITVSDGKASVSCGGLGNRRAADRYTFDPRTGRLCSFVPSSQAPASDRLRGWIYSLHVGSWGGTLTRVLAFLAALLGATLPLTGYWLWLRRLRRRHG